MNVDLSKALGKKHYNILKRVFMKEPYQGLTMNEILDLFQKIMSIDSFGLTGWIDTAPGARIEVVLGDASAVFHDLEPDKPALEGNIDEARRLLGDLGIEPNN